MAFIVLTPEQKEELLSNATFKLKVKYAITDKADFWAGHNGTSPPGGLERWRKSKTYALYVQNTPLVSESSDAVKLFLEYIKNVQCVDNTIPEYDVANTLTKLVALASFDTMADTWFDAQVATQR